MTSRALVLSASWLVACGTDVAQTADVPRTSTTADLCRTSPAGLVLPTAPELGGGDQITPWELVTDDYAAGEGPGLYVTARDGFRAYVNDRLVAVSRAPRGAEFVPLTWLPGDSVVTIIASAEAGAPLALVQLDDLERAHPSGSGWKVSTSPSGDFRAVDFDDSSFDEPVDYGPIGGLPGCDPQNFPADSSARWIGPPEGDATVAVYRYELHIAPIGFGEATTGGNGMAPVLVANGAELRAELEGNDEPRLVLLPEGTLDLRVDPSEVMACPMPCDGEPGKAVHELLGADETCAQALVPMTRNEQRITIGSNKTLVGLGRGAALRGASLDLAGNRNIIIRNLAIFDVNPGLIEAGDAIGLSAPSGVWIDHCTFRWISDGFTDAGTGTAGVTVSWSHYDGRNEFACAGRHPRAGQYSGAVATFDHVLWEHVAGRTPIVDHAPAQVHVLNSVVRDNSAYAVGSACGAQVLVEGTTIEDTVTPTSKFDCADLPGVIGLIRAAGGANVYGSGVGAHRVLGQDAGEPNDLDVFTPPYAYSREPTDAARQRVLARAGVGGPWTLSFGL